MAEENNEPKPKPEDQVDSSFMAVRRNSNFTSILICFLITTGANLDKMSFFGFQLGIFDHPWVIWVWIILIWVYFNYRYIQYFYEFGTKMIENAEIKAQRELFHHQDFIIKTVEEEASIAKSIISSKSLLEASLSKNDFDVYLTQPDAKVAVRYLSKEGQPSIPPSEYLVIMTDQTLTKWGESARRKSVQDNPAFITLYLPAILFVPTLAVILIRITYFVVIDLPGSLPPIFLHS
jgi:hypothetical protein